MKLPIVAALFIVIGCASPAPEVSSDVRALGIVEIDVAATDANVTIRGLGESGDERARLDLTVGRFVMQLDIDDPRGEVFGRQMSIRVLDEAADHESEGVATLTLPLPSRTRSIATFLVEPQVSRVLAARGITFEGAQLPPADTGEVAYDLIDQCWPEYGASGAGVSSFGSVGPCTAPTDPDGGGPLDYIPSAGCYADQFLVQSGGNVYGQFACCNASAPNGQKALERRCSTVPGNAGCGPNGSRGCAVCWSYDWVGDCILNGRGSTYCEMMYCY
jgi:hypothetical protein